jgi:glutathione S-transferase
MNNIVLFARSGSGSAVCEALLELTGHPYELKAMNRLADGSNPPELMTINPLGQIPALVTPDGTLMTESAAIALWIADLSPEAALAPAANDPLRAKYLRVMLFMAANCYMTALRFYYPDRYSTDERHAAGIKDKAREHMHREFSILTDMLGSDDYLVGNTMSAADLYLSMLVCWEEDGTQFAKKYPALWQHTRRVCANTKVAAVWKSNGFAV